MQGLSGGFVLNQERKDARMSRMFCSEPGKEGCKDLQDVLF